MTDGVIVLFKGHSVYDSVNTMVDQFAAAFARAGAETLCIDTRAPDCVPTVVRLIRENRVRLFFSLNGFGIPAQGQGPGFYAESAAPVVIYFVDHPAFHYPTIRAPLPRLAVTFPTAHYVDFCRDHIRADIAIHHLPHGTADADASPWNARDLPMFLSASVMADPEPYRAAWAQHGAGVAGSLNAIVEAHLAEPLKPLHEHIVAVLGAAPAIDVLASYFITADIYLRSRIKHELVGALAHLPLTVCGNGWDRLAQQKSVARFLPGMPAPGTIGMMRRAKLVLNPLPPYAESHERPLQAMINGAVAVNGPSGWMSEAFAGAYLALPAEPRAAAAAIEAALTDDDALQAIARRGTETCRADHLWDNRAHAILDVAAVSAG